VIDIGIFVIIFVVLISLMYGLSPASRIVSAKKSSLGMRNKAIIHLVILMSVAMVLLVLQKIVLAILAAAVAFAPWGYVYVKKKKRIDQFEKQFPDGLNLLAGALRAGNSFSAALAQLAQEFPAPLSEEFSLMVREQKMGLSTDVALQNFALRMPLNSVILTVSTIRIANETGGELAGALSKVAQTLRSIEQAEGKIKALTAQGKMQAWVVGLMPVFLIFILDKMEPEAMGQLWTTTAGWIALAGIIIFEFFGILVIRKIVNIDV
jgi:tight adherence protein B